MCSGSARPMNPERGDDGVTGKGGRPGVGSSDSPPAISFVAPSAFHRVRVISKALEGIEALYDRVNNPDGYCACTENTKCFLHGVAIPEAIKATESLLAQLKRESRA